MTRKYAESRIREAIDQSGGNITKARQLLTAWCQDDHRLVLELTAPHMVGISAHAIQRVMRLDKEKAEVETVPVPDEPFQEEALVHDGQADAFGLEILKAVAGNKNPKFGMNAMQGGGKGKIRVSAQHIDAINQMVRKSKSNRQDDF